MFAWRWALHLERFSDVENEQRVGLVEIHRKRMVECRTTAVAVRFPANQLHTRGIEGQTEDRGEGLVAGPEPGQAEDQHLVGHRTEGREHARPPHDEAFVRLPGPLPYGETRPVAARVAWNDPFGARRGLDFGYNTGAHL